MEGERNKGKTERRRTERQTKRKDWLKRKTPNVISHSLHGVEGRRERGEEKRGRDGGRERGEKRRE